MVVLANPCWTGVILYVSLLWLAVWRYFGHWKVGRQYSHWNYISGLYLLIGAGVLFEMVFFVLAVTEDFKVGVDHWIEDSPLVSTNEPAERSLEGHLVKNLSHGFSLLALEGTPHNDTLGQLVLGMLLPRASASAMEEATPYSSHHGHEVSHDHMLLTHQSEQQQQQQQQLAIAQKQQAHLQADKASTARNRIPTGQTIQWPVLWVRVLVLSSPAMLLLIIALAYKQSRSHLQEIKDGIANGPSIWEHDRVLNIIATPVVYGFMVFCALVHLYSVTVAELARAEKEGVREVSQVNAERAISAFESLIYIADLYEAWALYQFGQLTCDVLTRMLSASRSQEDTEGGRRSGEPESELTILVCFAAVTNVMWVGAWLFIAVCLVQAGWALLEWFIDNPSTDDFQTSLGTFTLAGMVASAAAIYNVHVVESTFGHFIAGYTPLLKFLSVKLLVFFSFWQGYVLDILHHIGILPFSEVEIKLLQASLLMFECFLGACVHTWAWDYREGWYAEDPPHESSHLLGDKKS